ncbi:MAG: VOC family protein [Thiohalocapsa sp.]
MPLPPPVLDHVVIDVRDRMDEAARTFTALGFHLTPRGHHTLGSINHLAMFATDYLELLGVADGASRPELAPFPVGLNGLVFKTEDADAVYAHARGAALPILPVQSFSRPVELDGRRHEAGFRTTRLDPSRTGPGRVYFCQHLTPDLVWRPEWRAHPNGVRAIARVVVAAADPCRSAALFATLFGAEAVAERGRSCVVQAGSAQVELLPPAAVATEFVDAAAQPDGRGDYLAGLELKVASLAATSEALRAVPGLRVDRERVVVPAHAAFNTTLAFTA